MNKRNFRIKILHLSNEVKEKYLYSILLSISKSIVIKTSWNVTFPPQEKKIQ